MGSSLTVKKENSSMINLKKTETIFSKLKLRFLQVPAVGLLH